jgi:hypothetical protein
MEARKRVKRIPTLVTSPPRGAEGGKRAMRKLIVAGILLRTFLRTEERVSLIFARVLPRTSTLSRRALRKRVTRTLVHALRILPRRHRLLWRPNR